MTTMELAQGASYEVTPFGLPLGAYVQPVFDGRYAEAEVIRSFYEGGISSERLIGVLSELAVAGTNDERVDIVNREHLLSPASPDPNSYHDQPCGCNRHGKIATQPNVSVSQVASTAA